LDVHAWSVTGHALDGVTGEVWQRKLTPDPGDILGWVSGLPGLRPGTWWMKKSPCDPVLAL
jgi:hypothetical protein